MYPVRFGASGVPVNLDFTSRFDVAGGSIVDSTPNEMPPVAKPRLVLGDILTTSATGRGAYDTEETRRMHIDGWNEAMGLALTGRRDDADRTVLTGVRLAAVGYVNAHDIMAGAHRPDVPLLTTNVEPIP